jgi:hypothetical protein
MGVGRPRLKESNIDGVAAYLDFSAPPLLNLAWRPGRLSLTPHNRACCLSKSCMSSYPALLGGKLSTEWTSSEPHTA